MPIPAPLPHPDTETPAAVPKPPAARPRKPSGPSFGLTLGLCVVASAVTALLVWAYSSANQGPVTSAAVAEARFAPAVDGQLVKVLRVGGTVETLEYASIRVPRLRGPRDAGRADVTLTMLADSGALVRRGDPIAEFELRWLVDHIQDRESALIAAESNLRKKAADIEILKETERQARVTSRAEFDKATLDVRTAEVRSEIEAEVLKNIAEEARATWKQLEDEGQIKERVHQADFRAEELTVRENLLHLERHERDLLRLNVTAPIDGMVVRETLFLNKQFAQSKAGDRIYPGALFMRIVDVANMVVNAAVNQTDAQSVRIGDEALVELDAYPGERFRGRVLDIGAVASSAPAGSPFSRGSAGAFIKHIALRVLIEDKDERILPDLSASVDVLASDRPRGVIVPREAVRGAAADDKPYVLVRSEAGYARRLVTVADTSDTQALIGSGLAAGDQVLLSQVPSELGTYQ